MSRENKRKHVMTEIDTYYLPHPTGNQQFAEVIASKGNNLHEVEPAIGDELFLASVPPKFRNNICIKRGNFVIIEVIEPIEEGKKVRAEIVRIVTDQQIKEFIKDGVWPKKFIIHPKQTKVVNCHSEDEDVVVRKRLKVCDSSDSDDADGSSDSYDADGISDSGDISGSSKYFANYVNDYFE